MTMPPAAPVNVRIAEGADPSSTAVVTWDPDPSATAAEVIVTPGLTTYVLDTPPPAAGDNPAPRTVEVTGLASDSSYSVQVRNVASDGKSPPASEQWHTRRKAVSGWWRATTTIFLLSMLGLAAVCGAGALYWYRSTGQRIAWYSSALALLVLFLGLLMPALTGGNLALWRVIVGADNRVSTSKTQILLWTLLIAFILVYFTSRTWFGGVQHLFDGLVPGGDNAGTGSTWPDYLVLLGGPFAAAVISKAAITTKSADGTIQKSAADEADADPRQIVTDDDGQPDLVDAQYFLFNLAALTYVIVGLAKTNALPQIPGLLLALTSASAATYAANKTIGQNKPVISGLTPTTVQRGQALIIDGSNFMPVGTRTHPSVTIGGSSAMVRSGTGDNQIQAIVPAGAQTGTTSVVVTTSAGIASDPQTVTIGSDTPVIRSISPALASPGRPLVIEGSTFYSALDAATKATVLFDAGGGEAIPPADSLFVHLADGLDHLETTVPAGLANTDLQIVVLTNRGAKSDPAPYRTGP